MFVCIFYEKENEEEKGERERERQKDRIKELRDSSRDACTTGPSVSTAKVYNKPTHNYTNEPLSLMVVYNKLPMREKKK